MLDRSLYILKNNLGFGKPFSNIIQNTKPRPHKGKDW